MLDVGRRCDSPNNVSCFPDSHEHVYFGQPSTATASFELTADVDLIMTHTYERERSKWM